MEKVIIDVVPMGAVRMTKSDTWKTNPNHINPLKRQRDVVRRYFEYKNIVVHSCNNVKYSMGEELDVVFFLPMPASWSEKKKKKMQFEPHKSKPDLDNLIKALMDSLKEQDSDVHKIVAEKKYDYTGRIEINNIC
jgi:hypothetical protein